EGPGVGQGQRHEDDEQDAERRPRQDPVRPLAVEAGLPAQGGVVEPATEAGAAAGGRLVERGLVLDRRLARADRHPASSPSGGARGSSSVSWAALMRGWFTSVRTGWNVISSGGAGPRS